MGKGTVVLAYSGGLDTSICIPLLRERYGYDRVVTVAVNVGQRDEEITTATEKGRKLADTHYTIDAREKFVTRYILPAIRANGSYEGYPMGTALARPLIAEEVVRVAAREGARTVAHGCTGKGNDQLRFDFIFRMAGLDVIAPIRELNLTRDWEIDYAREHGIPVPVGKERPWSVDENIWSRSIEGGMLEDPACHPPEEIYAWTVSPVNAPDKPEILAIDFIKGIPHRLNDVEYAPFDLIREMNTRAGRHGIGRNNMIEDRILGLKAREIYEHPAATVLLLAHHDLEHLTLTRQELAFKHVVDEKWSELAYMGLVHEPLFHDLSAFITQSQERVTGRVEVQMFKGCCRVLGRSSPEGLYSGDLVSFDTTSIDQCHAIGVSAYYGIQARLAEQGKKGRK
ncbi:MAG: argininosuccinate synthase [Methanolinea sp.]|jgi:argininosuccinate synthase|nr:argininosuccinate synthase [Methanolinea sp.]